MARPFDERPNEGGASGEGSFGGAPPAPFSPARSGSRQETADRILDGAQRALGCKGVRSTSMEDVARESGVTRMTVYRHFASREELMQALTNREMGRYYVGMLARGELVEQAAGPGENPVLQILVESIQYSIRHFGEHPIVMAMLERDADLILPFLTTRADVILGPAIAALAPDYDRWRERGWIGPLPSDRLAEWVMRLVMSWLIQPSPVIDAHDPDTIRQLVETFIWPVLDPNRDDPVGE